MSRALLASDLKLAKIFFQKKNSQRRTRKTLIAMGAAKLEEIGGSIVLKFCDKERDYEIEIPREVLDGRDKNVVGYSDKRTRSAVPNSGHRSRLRTDI